MSTAKKILSGSGASADRTNVEDVFNTHMYLGTGSSQTKTNYVDILNEGGMIWFKRRNTDARHGLYDTVRGATKILSPNKDNAQSTNSGGLTAFTSTGFTVNSATDVNFSGSTYVSWAFRKAPNFFDMVTYTSNSVGVLTVNHNLGQAPGMIFFKEINGSQEWVVWHRSASSQFGNLSYEGAWSTVGNAVVNSVSSTNFVLTESRSATNGGNSTTPKTYIAYLFAHNNNDGGFGPNGDLDIIKCGSFTTDASGSGIKTENIGFEPQWVIVKNITGNTGDDWYIYDTHRGLYAEGYNTSTGRTVALRANKAGGELNNSPGSFLLTSTGFGQKSDALQNGATFVYCAIRRSPTKEAEAGLEVFGINAGGSTNYFDSDSITYAIKSPDDLVIVKRRNSTSPADQQWAVTDRMRGIEPLTSMAQTETTGTPTLFTHTTNGEATSGSRAGKYPGTTGNSGGNAASTNIVATGLAPGISYWWRRSPGFFDVVGYVGDGATDQTITHNLQGIPKMVWGKRRDGLSSGTGSSWVVYYGSGLYNLFLNSNTNFTGLTAIHKVGASGFAIDSTTQFAVSVQSGGNSSHSLNTSGNEYILYIFGEQTGISKIGTYEGTGSDLNIDCGFAARWVMIRDVSSGSAGQGNWFVYDTTRGINAGSDPFIRFDITDAEASADYIDPHSSGFTVVGGQTHNVDDHNYFFYAIA